MLAGIIGLLLVVPLTCSQLSALGLPGAGLAEQPPRCRTGFEVTYLPLFEQAGWLDVGVGLLVAVAGVAAVLFVGHVRAHSNSTGAIQDSSSEPGE